MARIAGGDAAAFRSLSDAHLGRILTYANRLMKNSGEAEEVAQETFLRAWQKASRYEPRAKVSTWLHKIAHNLCTDRMRKSNVRGEDFAFILTAAVFFIFIAFESQIGTHACEWRKSCRGLHAHTKMPAQKSRVGISRNDTGQSNATFQPGLWIGEQREVTR